MSTPMAGLSSEHQALVQLLYAVPVGLVYASGDGAIEFINPAAARWLMPLSSNAKLENLFRILAGVAPNLRQVVEGQGASAGVVVDNLRIEIAGGRQRQSSPEFVALTLTRLDDERIMAVFSDVTQQVRDERALSASEAHYRAIISVMSEGIVIHDASGALISCNTAAERMAGGALSAAVTGAAKAFAWAPQWPDGRPMRFEETPTGVVLGGGPAQEQVPMFSIDATGARRWFDVSAQPVTALGLNSVLAVVTSFTEVTQRHLLLEQLHQHQEQLQELVSQRTADLQSANEMLRTEQRFVRSVTDAVPGMIGYWGTDLRCRFANKAYLEWFGRTPQEMVGLRMQDLMGEALFALNWPHVEAVLNGQAQHFERTLRRPDGSVGHTLASYIPDIVNGRVSGFNAVVSDVTGMQQAKLEVESANAQLAQRVLQATEATRAKSAFLANMSHEIRTPMNAIIGLNHLLKRDATDGLQRDRLHKVDDAAQHLLQVINDILDLSKIESGKMTLERREFSLDEVLERSASLVRARASDKGLELIADSDHLPDRMIGDPTRLSQILINLLANAVKFTTTGWVRVRGRLTSRDSDGLTVRFEVQDTGPGVPEEQQARLFQVFEQGDSSTTRQHGGTGLGLALTRKFATLMGGEAGVTSQIGAGSIFWFTAKFESVEDEHALRPGHTLQGLSALLVDDLPEAREAIGDRLKMFGMTVECRAHAAEALALLHETVRAGHSFDVLIVDWQMPGMDGLEMIRLARRSMGDGLPPTVLFTAYDNQAMWTGAREAGVSAVLLKPVTSSALSESLNHALHRLGAPRPSHSADSPGSAGTLLRGRHAGKRILLAEDNPINQEVAVELLQSVGLIVDTAENGQRAVEMALAQPYALVLMDVQMPVLDGLDATRQLRAQIGPELPIVAMTANAFGEDQMTCLNAGMNDHLAKPVNPELLYRTLLTWLSGADPVEPGTVMGSVGTIPELIHATSLSLAERLGHVPDYDFEHGLSSAGGDLKRLVRILRSFLGAYQDGDGASIDAASRGDRPAIRATAHSVRGACATVGASTAADLAETLELTAQTGDLESLREHSRQLNSSLQRISAAIAKEMSL
jgi:two-component system, sensor histidine kinase and response regulator